MICITSSVQRTLLKLKWNSGGLWRFKCDKQVGGLQRASLYVFICRVGRRVNSTHQAGINVYELSVQNNKEQQQGNNGRIENVLFIWMVME